MKKIGFFGWRGYVGSNLKKRIYKFNNFNIIKFIYFSENINIVDEKKIFFYKDIKE